MSSETIIQNHTHPHEHARARETAERKQVKGGEVFIAIRKEIKYLIEK